MLQLSLQLIPATITYHICTSYATQKDFPRREAKGTLKIDEPVMSIMIPSLLLLVKVTLALIHSILALNHSVLALIHSRLFLLESYG
mmetsp:Transcript_39657/g.72619  ORF Transcript_39657/g.72619 Transcript_39657/m.72619 type:complete len:87 (-) Transcript_39657:61-321(-)